MRIFGKLTRDTSSLEKVEVEDAIVKEVKPTLVEEVKPTLVEEAPQPPAQPTMEQLMNTILVSLASRHQQSIYQEMQKLADSLSAKPK